MPHEVQFIPAAARQFRKLPLHIRKRIRESLEKLRTNPRPNSVKKMSGYDDRWRIRVGDYRVIYQIKDDVLQILIVRVAHRRDVYR